MATAEADYVIYDDIHVSVFPNLNSNLTFINGHALADRIQKQACQYLSSMGYNTKPGQQMVQAGGTGYMIGFIETVQMLWEHKSLISLPVIAIKAMRQYYLVNSIRKLQTLSGEFTIVLQFESTGELTTPGRLSDKHLALTSLLAASNELRRYLRNEYSNINFNRELTIRLDRYKSSIVFALPHKYSDAWRVNQFIKLFKTTSMSSNRSTYVAAAKFGLAIRTDYRVHSDWSLDLKHKKKYYFIFPGRIVSRDFSTELKAID